MSSATHLLENATTHHQAGRLPEAERAYIETLDLDAHNADALRLLGALYVQIGQPIKAVQFFERAHAADPANAETLNNLGVALRNCGRFADAIARYEQALTIDPAYAQARTNLSNAYYDFGNDLITRNRRYESGQWFEKAVQADPTNFRAHNNLAGILRNKGHTEKAHAHFSEALRLKPDYIEARINLGNVLRDLGRPDEAMECYRQVLQQHPQSSDAINNLGTLLQDLGRMEEAVERYDEVLRIKPDSAITKSNKGYALLAMGQYEQGWALNEAGLGLIERRGVLPFPLPQWDGRSFVGQRLLIWSEQGLGDNLQFIRYAALCKQRGGTVIVQCPQPLARLFENCPGVDRVVSAATGKDFDHHVAMMSLPHIFGTTLETVPATVPYLFISEAARQKWKPKFAGVEGYKIGLVWAGSSREHIIDANLIDRRRSMHLQQLKPLFDLCVPPPLGGGQVGEQQAPDPFCSTTSNTAKSPNKSTN